MVPYTLRYLSVWYLGRVRYPHNSALWFLLKHDLESITLRNADKYRDGHSCDVDMKGGSMQAQIWMVGA